MTTLGIRSVLAATASALVLSAASQAQDVTALEERLAALEAMVADLRGELEEARAQADAATDRVIEIEQRTASAPAASDVASSSRAARRLKCLGSSAGASASLAPPPRATRSAALDWNATCVVGAGHAGSDRSRAMTS